MPGFTGDGVCAQARFYAGALAPAPPQFVAGCPRFFEGFPFLGATRSIEPISYGNVSGWLGGCLSVTAGDRYCIKTTKPILKLF